MLDAVTALLRRRWVLFPMACALVVALATMVWLGDRVADDGHDLDRVRPIAARQEAGEQAQQQPSSPLAPVAAAAGSAAASTEIFTHDEIVCLRLIFALFDDNGDDYVDEGELVRYAEETGAEW